MTQSIKKARLAAGLNKHFGRNSTSRLAALLVGVSLAYAFVAGLLCLAASTMVGGAP